jgi:hypothetical protein
MMWVSTVEIGDFIPLCKADVRIVDRALERYTGTERQRGKRWVKVLRALSELVRLKDLHDRIERVGFTTIEDLYTAHIDYIYNKQAAWDTARTLVQSSEEFYAYTFQTRVMPWMLACFGAEISSDTVERNHRFLEESLELVQACGCTQDDAHQLVDYVYGRPVGKLPQEVGGVMVTLAALCLANKVDMHALGEVELARIWTLVDQIRAKQKAKPKFSPLPE